jgi:beta-mannosidase
MGGKLADRTFCFANFEAVKDCLFRLPRTELSLEAKEDALEVSNCGKVPAVAVNVSRPGHADTFRASDNFFWLDPGESHSVQVNDTVGTTAEAWNADRCGPQTDSR